MRGLVRIWALRERGGRVMTAGSTGSTPRDCAGGPSIKMSRGANRSGNEDSETQKHGELTDP